MGRDKAVMIVDGLPMASRVAAALASGGCEPVVAIGGARTELERFGLGVVPDRFPGEGPLGGIITALLDAPVDVPAVFVASCDLPRLSGAAVHAVLAALALAITADVAIAVGDRDQPLCAAWRQVALPSLQHLFSSGERRVSSAIRELSVARVELPREVLLNVNTIADLPE
jgi:molybdopterin-guanine dinucleotide biosynthesis protein A